MDQNSPHPSSTRPSSFAAPPPFRVYGSIAGAQDSRTAHAYDPLRWETDIRRTAKTTPSYGNPASYAMIHRADASPQQRPLSPVRYGAGRSDTNGHVSSRSPMKLDMVYSKESVYREGKTILNISW
jgi:hypothetical protein